MCVVCISYEMAIISLYINILVFITESKCVYCTARTESSNTFQVNTRLPSITSHQMLCLYPKWFCIETDEAFSLKFTWLPELLCVNFRTQHPIGTITLGSLSYVFLPYKKSNSVYVSCCHSCKRTDAQIRSVIRLRKCDVFRGWNEREDKRAASTTGGCFNIKLLQNARI